MKKSKNKINFTIGIIIITGLFVLIAIGIASIFKHSPYGDLLEIKDFFNFAGSFGGAILGGLVSIMILKFTLDKQKEQFDEERRLEKEKYIIENNIETYRELYNLCKKMLIEINSLIEEINNNKDFNTKEQYNDVLLYFKKSCDNINMLVYDFTFTKLSINEDLFIDNNIMNLNNNIDEIYKEFKSKKLSVKEIKKIVLELEGLNCHIENYIDNIIGNTLALNNKRLLSK
ncbi:hypothetical protein [Clostridium sp. B9]|uniref:hypothetical protein n=1 Tax=Clostridium sp. B9 TaxID=3423224 RepID=UPI003D2F4DA0